MPNFIVKGALWFRKGAWTIQQLLTVGLLCQSSSPLPLGALLRNPFSSHQLTSCQLSLGESCRRRCGQHYHRIHWIIQVLLGRGWLHIFRMVWKDWGFLFRQLHKECPSNMFVEFKSFGLDQGEIWNFWIPWMELCPKPSKVLMIPPARGRQAEQHWPSGNCALACSCRPSRWGGSIAKNDLGKSQVGNIGLAIEKGDGQ